MNSNGDAKMINEELDLDTIEPNLTEELDDLLQAQIGIIGEDE